MKAWPKRKSGWEIIDKTRRIVKLVLKVNCSFAKKGDKAMDKDKKNTLKFECCVCHQGSPNDLLAGFHGTFICEKCLTVLETLFTKGTMEVEIKLYYRGDSPSFLINTQYDELRERLEAIRRNEIKIAMEITERTIEGCKRLAQKSKKEMEKAQRDVQLSEARLAKLNKKLKQES